MQSQLENLKKAWLQLGDKMEQANSLLDCSYNSDNFSQSLQSLFQWLGDTVRVIVVKLISSIGNQSFLIVIFILLTLFSVIQKTLH